MHNGINYSDEADKTHTEENPNKDGGKLFDFRGLMPFSSAEPPFLLVTWSAYTYHGAHALVTCACSICEV